jgi:hypothetical protein
MFDLVTGSQYSLPSIFSDEIPTMSTTYFRCLETLTAMWTPCGNSSNKPSASQRNNTYHKKIPRTKIVNLGSTGSRTFSSLIVVRFHLVLLHFQCISSTPVWLSFEYDVWDCYTVLGFDGGIPEFKPYELHNHTTSKYEIFWYHLQRYYKITKAVKSIQGTRTW